MSAGALDEIAGRSITVRRPARRAAQTVALVFACAVVTCGVGLVSSYGLRFRDTASAGDLPATAIVFTGQFDRIEEGLRLLEEGRVARLFISGVNGGAGLNPQTFARQFSLSSRLEEGLSTGLVTLAAGAQDTIENAIETSCWLARYPETESILLITSHRHMPRASLLLEQASGLSVERLSTAAAAVDAQSFLSPEFRRFVASWFMTFLPPRLWPARSGFACVAS